MKKACDLILKNAVFAWLVLFPWAADGKITFPVFALYVGGLIALYGIREEMK